MFVNVRFAALFALVALTQLASAQVIPASTVSAAAAPAPATDASAVFAPVDVSAAADPAPVEAASAPTKSKIVASLDCSSGFKQTGNLTVSADKSTKSGVQITGDSSNLRVDENSNTPAIFTECSSSTMGYKSSGNEHFGLLSPLSATELCFGSSSLAQGDQPLEGMNCTLSDDSSQMTQYWKFDASDNSLVFVGRPSGSSGFYSLDVSANLVDISPSGSTSTSLYLV